MAAPIAPITPPRLIEPLRPVSPAPASGTTFSQALGAALQHAANSSAQAHSAAQDYMSGGNRELHSVVLATQTASLDLQLLLQVRNKVVSAYEEIMKMQI